MLYLYCLVSAGREPPPPLRGLADAPVRQVTAQSVGAWVSDLPAAIEAVTPELVRAHDVVVREAMRVETPLPARFGQTFADESALRRSLEERREGIVAGLGRVRGAVEMTVRLLLDPAAAAAVARPAAKSGREYMAWLRARQRAAEEAQQRAGFLQARVARAVGGLARAEARSGASAGGNSATISHLVACGDVTRYRHLVHELTEREPELRVMLSGPWAPYSFAELPGA
jgi:hypothetical protein